MLEEGEGGNGGRQEGDEAEKRDACGVARDSVHQLPGAAGPGTCEKGGARLIQTHSY